MKFSKNSGKKKAAAAAVICFVAAIAITGTYTFNDYKRSKAENELAKVEESNVAEEKYTVSEGESLLDEPVDGNVVANEAVDDIDTEEDALTEEDLEEETQETSYDDIIEDFTEYTSDVSANSAASVNFSSDSKILWPVAGILLMDYSMDQTVYFKTLDQYKYNPAIVVAAAENDQVIAGVSGIVKSIDNIAETGTTITLDLGNGYEAIYGQLLNVQVQTGDYVEAATLLGHISAPTKYYSSEGSNLYFEMRKDGRPIDPKEYLVDYQE